MGLFIFEKISFFHEINLQIAFVIQAFNVKKPNEPNPLLQFGFKKKNDQIFHIDFPSLKL